MSGTRTTQESGEKERKRAKIESDRMVRRREREEEEQFPKKEAVIEGKRRRKIWKARLSE